MDQDRTPGYASADDPRVGASIDALLRRAIAIYRQATVEEDYNAIWPVLDEARGLGREALAAGIALLSSNDAIERGVACDLLGTLCNPDERNFGPEVATAVVGAARQEDDAEVLWTIARALGHARDPRGVGTLVRLCDHPDGDVRFQVALALPSCEEGSDTEVLAQALIRLMYDPDDDIRDWATFGLGTLTEIDGPEVRQALLRRLGDHCLDARDEAIVALARRRDRRVLPVVMAQLRTGEIGRLTLEAAAYLGDEELLVPLRGLKSWWHLDPALLDEALTSCDPEQQRRALDDQTAFMALLEARLAARPEVERLVVVRSPGTGGQPRHRAGRADRSLQLRAVRQGPGRG